MKTLKDYEQEFDEKDCVGGNFGTMTHTEIKQFYRRAFADLMEEMVGEDKPIPKQITVTDEMWNDIAGVFKVENQGYNQAKAEVRENRRKMLD